MSGFRIYNICSQNFGMYQPAVQAYFASMYFSCGKLLHEFYYKGRRKDRCHTHARTHTCNSYMFRAYISGTLMNWLKTSFSLINDGL